MTALADACMRQCEWVRWSAREGCSVRVGCIGQGALTSPSAVVMAVQSEICRSVIVIEAPTLACTAPPYACRVRDTRKAIV